MFVTQRKWSSKRYVFCGSRQDSHFVWWVLWSNCVIQFKGTLIKYWVTQIFASKTAIAIWTVLCHPLLRHPRGDFFLNLLVFSDGVNIKKSTLRTELWPIWIQIADLPPSQRMSWSNIILAALFVGNVTPNWNELVPHIKSELLSSIKL